MGSLRGTAWGSSSFLHCLDSRWFLQPKVMAPYLPGIGTWAGVPGVGLALFASEACLPDFYPHNGCGTSPFSICSPPASRDGCGFFNYVVVILHSAWYVGSKWWWFCSSVVILMWLRKEVSCVYLCCHLDQKY